ncbi:MAG: hypothetical protein GY816_23365 [Cytophagales bacterium]|nr:hypothetical protein [Cytophagales bacterium]
MKKIEKRNRELIVRYFEDNPNSTKKSCCKYVGVSHVTLNKHLRQIEEKGNE